jgi:hypothetical protein
MEFDPGVNSALVPQVEFVARRDKDPGETGALQAPYDGRSDHPSVAGDENRQLTIE